MHWKSRAYQRRYRKIADRVFILRHRLWWDLGPARRAMLVSKRRATAGPNDGFIFMCDLRAIVLEHPTLEAALAAGRILRASRFGPC